jgi:murein DD-endopeptidase MepM/ murein hydrolase activator NlpD
MKKRRYSILVVPEDNGEVKSYRASSTQGRILILGITLLLATTAFLAIQYAGKAKDTVALGRLRRENSYLRAQVTRLDDNILEFQTQMADLMERDKILRTMADLSEIDPDVRKVGIGGQSYEDLVDSRLSSETTEILPNSVLADVDQLLRQAKLENQSFQEVQDAFQKNRERLEHTPAIWPTSGYVSRGYGPCTDPFTGRRRPHEGIDIVNRVGTPVVATAAGRIAEKGWKTDYGWMVVADHGYGYKTAYAHLDSIKVRKGERVKRGQVIATLGNSGRSTGPHLHYEVRVKARAVNPLKYILPDVVVD